MVDESQFPIVFKTEMAVFGLLIPEIAMSKLKMTLLIAGLTAIGSLLPAAAQFRNTSQAGTVIAYEHPDFRGQSRVFDSPVRDLNFLRFNDTISSIELRGAWELCEHPDFRGRCETVSGPVYDLHDIRMNDNITSLRPVRLRGERNANRPRARRANGVEGRSTVFFPDPRDEYGDRIRVERGNAARFCREMGYRGVAYANRSRRNLSDVLCEK